MQCSAGADPIAPSRKVKSQTDMEQVVGGVCGFQVLDFGFRFACWMCVYGCKE